MMPDPSPVSNTKSDIAFGIILLGTTGVLIGVAIHSEFAMIVAGLLGAVMGGFVGWLGGRMYLLIICCGVLIGAFLGYQMGDRDILIIAAGSGGAIAGFLGAQIELFLRKK